MRKQERVLDGKVAIITGAGRGIGKAIAIAYAKAGASVCYTARTLSEIQDTVREIEKNGGKGLAIQTDVTQLESVKHMFEKSVAHFGSLDILVINAGGNYDRRRVEDSNLPGIVFEESELTEFLVRVKVNTYASGGKRFFLLLTRVLCYNVSKKVNKSVSVYKRLLKLCKL